VEKKRQTSISGRFSTTHDGDALQFHRELVLETLNNRLDSQALNPAQYWQELRNAKVLLSPFGCGEICFRDFEGFMSGCLVVKPKMDHLETWPPLYEDGETMLSVDWDMSDLEETVEWALSHDDERKSIAREGQTRYRRYITGDSAADKFVDKFMNIVV